MATGGPAPLVDAAGGVALSVPVFARLWARYRRSLAAEITDHRGFDSGAVKRRRPVTVGMETVSETRLRADIESTAAFGAVDSSSGRGRTVLTGTDANRAAREFLVTRMEDAGLDVEVDAVGNIAGTWVGEETDPAAPPVATGSHLDSVPRGGIFDGPLGVYAALESVRALQDDGFDPARPVLVVSFTEEEGQRFGPGLLGSSVATGKQGVEEALLLRDDDGLSLREALSDIGFLGDGRLDASEWDSWLELHVEQDTALEEAGVPVGVVTTITGIAHYEAVISGEANHAGATAMFDRRDALVAAGRVVEDVEAAAREVALTESETAVATVGSLEVTPNATNVVPGSATLGIDVRDVDRDSMDELADRITKSLTRVEAERAVATGLRTEMRVDPQPMSERLRDALHRAGDASGVETMDLPSGAAHDTMHVADVTDAALLFAPSRDGLSHNPKEWTDWADCAAATRVMAGALAELAGSDVRAQ